MIYSEFSLTLFAEIGTVICTATAFSLRCEVLAFSVLVF